MKNTDRAEPELSRPLFVDKIPAGGIAEKIVARQEERTALAKRFGIPEISLLEADLDVDLAKGNTVSVTGSVRARVVQECVVSLEPVVSDINDRINVIFAPKNMMEFGANPPHGDGLEDDVIEPIDGGAIDLGELVAQHLALALNPYPRKDGAVLASFKVEEEKVGPFAKLAKLKNPNKLTD